MRKPSRLMPPPKVYKVLPSFVGWILLAALCGGAAWLCYSKPRGMWALVAIAGSFAAFYFWGVRKHNKLLAARAHDSIGTFSREFSVRQRDTWVLRATYETLSAHVGYPVRKHDCLEKVIGSDWLDWEDVSKEIARRSQRALTKAEENPLYGRVTTVGDLVEFFEKQPKVADVE